MREILYKLYSIPRERERSMDLVFPASFFAVLQFRYCARTRLFHELLLE